MAFDPISPAPASPRYDTVRMRALIGGEITSLRFEPTAKRIRGYLGGELVFDTEEALLVWEPRRIVPSYAVPRSDILAAVEPVDERDEVDDGTLGFPLPEVTRIPVLDPRIPFEVRTTEGDPVEIHSAAGRVAAGFRAADSALADHVIVAFDDIDRWLEEDDEIVAHPRDPYHRIDIRNSSRRVQVSLNGLPLADTTRARFVFETMLPPRLYLPVEDVLVPLVASATRTWCAYKGEAGYYSVQMAGGVVEDLAWQYSQPLSDATEIAGYVAFWNEKVDVAVDGVARIRPISPWS